MAVILQKKYRNMKISIVICTYNGAKFLGEQLDSIVSQSLSPYEVIAQDDGSSDGTWNILLKYAERYPYIKVYKNPKERGINNNFFSAIKRATGDLIAISDQDDIWESNKLEIMSKSIGDNLMCVGRSVPFYCKEDKNISIHYDSRKPNCNIIRMMYASMPGHCTLFRKELLTFLPKNLESCPIYTHTWYDVILGQTAAALNRIILIDKIVVKQRRYQGAASYSAYDKKRIRSANNALSMIGFGIRYYHKIKPLSFKLSSLIEACAKPAFLKVTHSPMTTYPPIISQQILHLLQIARHYHFQNYLLLSYYYPYYYLRHL